MSMRAMTLCCGVGLMLTCGASAEAGTPAYSYSVADSDGFFAFTIGTSDEQVEGWQVRFESAAQVTHLGIYDTGIEPETDEWGDPGIAVEVPLGVWNTSGDLLAQTVIPAGNSVPLTGLYRYIEIPSITVQPGEELIFGRFLTLGAWFGGDENFESFPNFGSPQPGFQLSSDLTYIGLRNESSVDELTFPSNLTGGFEPWGAGAVTFQYQAVPAPGGALLLGLSAVTIGARRRRRHA